MVYLQCWHGWCHMKLLPSWSVLCTPYNHAPCHFMQSHIRKVYVCLAVTCYLHLWQNDQGLLRATAVNIKITSRTCRFETCRYLQLPYLKLRLLAWKRVTYSILFHKVIKVLLPLSLTHAHAQRHRINTQFARIQKLATVKSQALFFRHYVYCL